MSEAELLKEISNYFENEIIEKHLNNLIKKHSKLKNYQINPILIKYLSQLKENDVSSEGLTKALFYPRALGTSITGSFGSKFQKMFSELGMAKGSLIDGMDIEYIDKIDSRKKYCQLKSGPNTINSKDVNPILREFDKVVGLARTNSYPNFNNNDLILGIIYGEKKQLSGHYQRIDKRYPVIIGEEFWLRITGYKGFYKKLIFKIDNLIYAMSSDKRFEDAYSMLLEEVRKSDII